MNLSPHKSRLITWIKWIVVVFFAAGLVDIFIPDLFHPLWLERGLQRQTLIHRVHAAGGWQVIRQACIALVQTNDSVQWIRWRTNHALALPPAIMALQPDQVHYTSPKRLGREPDENPVPVVRIKLFGLHRTGGHSTPYLGIEVVATSPNEEYTPKSPWGGDLKYRKVSEGVYEVFY